MTNHNEMMINGPLFSSNHAEAAMECCFMNHKDMEEAIPGLDHSCCYHPHCHCGGSEPQSDPKASSAQVGRREGDWVADGRCTPGRVDPC